MARIPDAELARLKAEVSVQRLVEGCGVVLRKQGKDLVGAGPFHDDSSPSLVVTPGMSVSRSGQEAILEELASVGYEVESLAELRNSGVRYREAIPVLCSLLKEK